MSDDKKMPGLMGRPGERTSLEAREERDCTELRLTRKLTPR